MRYEIDQASYLRQCAHADYAMEQLIEAVKEDAKERGVKLVFIDDMIIEELPSP